MASLPTTAAATTAVLHLIRASSVLQEQCDRVLSAVHGVALNEALLLMHLERAEAGRLSRVDLAKRLNTSASTVTRMAQPMERRGLVDRASDPRDARLTYVVLTEPGRELGHAARQSLARVSEELFGDLWDDQEIDLLGRLLGRLIAGQPGRVS